MPRAVTSPGASNNIVGNVYDKYGTRNPLARYLMRGFLGAVTELYQRSGPARVLEVGCGEGALADHLITHADPPPKAFEACDLSLESLRPGLDPRIQFHQASIHSLPYADASFDLVVCCEVLEHLENPAGGLAELARVARRDVLLSVPWEPTWRLLNLLRGRYWRDLGNTPGHIQHFSRRAFLGLVRGRLVIKDVRKPLPWTVLRGATFSQEA